MLDVRKLVLLREVGLRGSISAAAEALSYSHSAVSQQLSALEAQVGVPLLEKVGRSVQLTRAAEELTRHTDDIITILEQAESDLASRDTTVRGVVRLAAFTTISRLAVPEVIATLHARHPDLEIRYRQVEPETGVQLLASRRIDVLVADSYPGTSAAVPADLSATRLCQDPIRAYPPAGLTVSTVDDLRRLRWVLEPEGTESNAFTRRMCQRQGFEPNVAYESPDLLFHARLVQAGLAAAFLPDLLVRDARVQLDATDLFDTQHLRDISLICRAGAEHRPSVQACREAFIEHLKQLSGSSHTSPRPG